MPDCVVDERALGELEREHVGREPGALERAGDDAEDVAGEELTAATGSPRCRAGVRASARHHSAACRQASSSTQPPMSSISPASSAIGMNASGATRPKPGRSQRSERLEAADHAGVGGDERLAEQAQLVARHRLAQRGLERDLRRDPVLHRLVEELVATAPVALGAVHRDVGVRQDLVGRLVAVGREGHADARAHVASRRCRSGTAPGARR